VRLAKHYANGVPGLPICLLNMRRFALAGYIPLFAENPGPLWAF
jgi:hypothetical protein